MFDDRGQAHTLEAFAAALVVLSGVVFALQATAVTPLTGSTSSQYIENQQASQAESLLAAEAANGSVDDMLLYWNETERRFHGAGKRGYTSGLPPTAFGTAFSEAFLERGIAYNVNVYSVRPGPNGSVAPANATRERTRLVYLGEPTEHATVATRTVTLSDDDRLLAADGTPTADTLGAANTTYFAPDADPDSGLFGVFEVEVVLWRM
ncbi:DUF7288 family protein [Halobaculum lipolyticum]|uniref:Uncharacterized protein n=1 Tax=Halobaculum lipolyticum TaxID=3032001 RepID=A0ABD5W791_9EURY|nr:hypothetical protein [Halobaculum sp. DT31]